MERLCRRHSRGHLRCRLAMAHATCSWRLPHSAAAALRSRSPAAPAKHLSKPVSCKLCGAGICTCKKPLPAPQLPTAHVPISEPSALLSNPRTVIYLLTCIALQLVGMPRPYISASRRTSRCCVLPCSGLGLKAAQLQQLVQAVHGLPRSAEPLRQLCSHPAQRKGHARAPACVLLQEVRSDSRRW